MLESVKNYVWVKEYTAVVSEGIFNGFYLGTAKAKAKEYYNIENIIKYEEWHMEATVNIENDTILIDYL